MWINIALESDQQKKIAVDAYSFDKRLMCTILDENISNKKLKEWKTIEPKFIHRNRIFRKAH